MTTSQNVPISVLTFKNTSLPFYAKNYLRILYTAIYNINEVELAVGEGNVDAKWDVNLLEAKHVSQYVTSSLSLHALHVGCSTLPLRVLIQENSRKGQS